MNDKKGGESTASDAIASMDFDAIISQEREYSEAIQASVMGVDIQRNNNGKPRGHKPTEEEVYESRKTTPKMKLFASLIGEGLSPPEAYRKAYDCTNSSNATIVTNANKLLNDARIGLLLEPIYHAKKEMVIQDELAVRRFVMSELFTHAKDADGTGHKIKALELMGKAVGLFNDKTSDEHDDSADVEKLKAELRAKMASLLGVDDKKH
jgi:hypothetical protein